MTPSEIKSAMLESPEFWFIPFMDFVDEFRRNKNHDTLRQSLIPDNERMDALLASTIEFLCHEAGNEPPSWAGCTLFPDVAIPGSFPAWTT